MTRCGRAIENRVRPLLHELLQIVAGASSSVGLSAMPQERSTPEVDIATHASCLFRSAGSDIEQPSIPRHGRPAATSRA